MRGWTNDPPPSLLTSGSDATTSADGTDCSTQEMLESPVRNERRTPGSGTGAAETAGGDLSMAPRLHVHWADRGRVSLPHERSLGSNALG